MSLTMEKNESTVNFIKHQLSVSEKFIDDDRLSPLHISLYYALFQCWNLYKFRNPISICRSEIMRASKIGSVNTYTKCLKELSEWKYIQYLPSHNPHKGSLVYMYKFDNTTNNGNDISTNKSISNSTEKTKRKTTDKTAVTALRPSLNNTKQIVNSTNNLNLGNEQSKNNSKNKSVKNSSATKKSKKNIARAGANPTLQEIKNHFAQNNWHELEAEKFYNYFESNGWLVGGRTPMKNWKASANNWILNAKKFQSNENNKANNRAGKLHTPQSKNYGEAL